MHAKIKRNIAIMSNGALDQLDVNQYCSRQHDAMNDALGAAEMHVILNDMRARGIRLARRRDGAGKHIFAAA